MKQNKKIVITIIAVLALMTAALALLHFGTREQVAAGTLLISHGEESTNIEIGRLPTTAVTGVIVNGKGEEKPVDTQGVPLSEVLLEAGLDPAGVNTVTVTADDEFSAELSAGEVNAEGKAYLAAEEDGSLTLIVFGDPNAKRNVRNVVKLNVE